MFSCRFKFNFVYGLGFGLGAAIIASFVWLAVLFGGIHLGPSHHFGRLVTVLEPDDIEIVSREATQNGKYYLYAELKLRNLGSRTYHGVLVTMEYYLGGNLVNTCSLHEYVVMPPRSVTAGEMRCYSMDIRALSRLEEKVVIKEAYYRLRPG